MSFFTKEQMKKLKSLPKGEKTIVINIVKPMDPEEFRKILENTLMETDEKCFV